MGEMLLIGGVIGLVIWLAGSSGGKDAPADPSKVPVKPPVPPEKAAACKDCMCPDATISLVAAQRTLITLKFLPAKTASGKKGDDGVCGSLTQAAIRNYQVARGLRASGFVDKETSIALAAETSPPVATSSSSEVEKIAAMDYAEGCNAGSKDAVLSANYLRNAIAYSGPSAVVEAKNDNYKDVSAEWDQGYRTCFSASLTGSGILIDEDGLLYPAGVDEGDKIIIGEVLDENEADSDEESDAAIMGTRRVGRLNNVRAAAIKGRAHVRRLFL